MQEKIKNQKGFIQIPLLIGIILSLLAVSGITYGAIEYNKTSKIIKEAEQLSKEEKYNEAIGKLEVAQNKLLGKIILKQKISTGLDTNKKLLADKTKYDEGVNRFNEGNLQGSIDLLSELPESSFYYQKAQTKTEEAKRKMVEGELSEEQVVRKGAEAKAKQEEFEKNLKEQQLISKEAEEKMMNADNDEDGLTYREELSKGTSDFNRDSDGDGINDKEDAHPAGIGDRNQEQTFEWSYGGYKWSWQGSIQGDWYLYYRNKQQRSDPQSLGYVTYNDPFIQEVSKKILEAAKENNLCESCLALSFVHSLSYIDDKYTGYAEYPKYPVETFFDKNGDCEDSSYLTASIIRAMNIDAALVLLPGHMAVAVWTDCNNPGTYYRVGDKCYYYAETTNAKDWAIGEIPPDAAYSKATLINVSTGVISSNLSPQYKKPCYVSKDFPGYYSDGKIFYSDNQCNNIANCIPFEGFYANPQTITLYHDSVCSQIVVKGCYKSKSYPGYFYKSGTAWYYDSQCTQLYQSMSCNYPSIWSYSCTSEYSYSSKKAPAIIINHQSI